MRREYIKRYISLNIYSLSFTYEMFPEGLKRSAMFLANATHRLMTGVIRDLHVLH